MKQKALSIQLTLLCFIISPCLGNQQITLIGPRHVSTDGSYKAVLSTFDMKPGEDLYIAMKSNENFYGVEKFNGNTFQEIAFQLPPKSHEPYKLMGLLVGNRGKKKTCIRREAPVGVSTINYFTLIQTDKPVYKSGDVVNFRVLVLDHHTKPYTYNSLNVNIIDDSGRVKKSFKNVRRSSQFSFYKNSFTLSTTPTFGKWMVEVQVDDSAHKSSQSFYVKDFKPPQLDVYLESESRVAFEVPEPVINLRIYAKLPSSATMIKGSAKIDIKVYLTEDPSDIQVEKSSQVQVEGVKDIKFKIKELGVNYLTSTAIIEFNVEFTEQGTGRKSTQIHKVEVIPEGRHYAEIAKPDSFKPGFSYKIKAYVFNINDEPEKSTSMPFTLRVSYEFKDVRKSTEVITEIDFLKDGKASFVLNTDPEAIRMNLKFEFEKFQLEESVDPQKDVNVDAEFMQVTYEPERPKVGDILNIMAESNGEMRELSIIVIGMNGLIYSENYADSLEMQAYNLKLKITQDMAPEATVIVFYTKDQNGDVVYDEFKLALGFKGTNHLSIEALEKLKSGDTTKITLKTQPNSLVMLLGIDQSSRYLTSTNELISENVGSQMETSQPSLKYDSDIKISTAVTIQFSKGNKRNCFLWELDIINKVHQRSFKIPAAESDVFKESESIQKANDLEASRDNNLIGKYFPDVWLFDSVEVSSKLSTIDKKVPDQITNWTISGYSLHKEHGLAIAEPQHIQIIQEFSIKVEQIPNDVKVGEIFKIDLKVFNYADGNQDVNLKIDFNQDELELLDEKTDYRRPGCNSYTKNYRSMPRLNVNSKSTGSYVVFARVLKSGDIKINFEANGQGVSDTSEKIIKADYEGITQYLSNSFMLDLRKGSFRKDITIDLPNNVDPSSIKIEAYASGNLLGAAMNNSERFNQIPKNNLEYALKSFATAIYAYKNLKSNSHVDPSVTRKALDDISNEYENIKSMQSSDGGFKIFSYNASGVWMSSYVAQLLGDASEFIAIEERVRQDLLQFLLAKKDVNEGCFNDDGFTLRPLQGAKPYRKIYMTAFVMIGFLKNKNLESYSDYSETINEGVNYISTAKIDYDYERAMVAYALALADKNFEANRIFNLIGWNFITMEKKKIKALQIEIASYAILASLKLRKTDKLLKAGNWLIEQRKPSGEFFSTHDTVLGLQALTALSEHLGDFNPSMDIQFTAVKSRQEKNIEIKSSIKSTFVALPSSDKKFTVSATGSGMALVNVFAEFKSISNENNGFKLLLIPTAIANGLQLAVRVSSTTSNMAIVEVELPTGYEYSKHSVSEEVMEVDFSAKNRVILYFNSITPATYSKTQTIEATKVFDVKESKKSAVKVYDFYEPEFYKTINIYEIPNQLNCRNVPEVVSETSTLRQSNIERNLVNSRASEQREDVMENLPLQSDEILQFYWTAAILERDRVLCYASLVSNKLAITVGTCLRDKKNYDLRLRILEKNSWNNKFETKDQYIKQLSQHESIGLILLYSPILNPSIVSIPSNDLDFTSANCIVSGWANHYYNALTKSKATFSNECLPERNDNICANNEINIIGKIFYP